MFTCLKRNLTKEIKVAQLAGSVAEHSAYHHGEVSCYQDECFGLMHFVLLLLYVVITHANGRVCSYVCEIVLSYPHQVGSNIVHGRLSACIDPEVKRLQLVLG